MNKYKESYYNFKKITKDNGMLVYNTKTGAIVYFEPNEKSKVLHILDNPTKMNNDKLLEKLLYFGFIVEGDINELLEIKNWHEYYIKQNQYMNLTLIPVDACNFNCPYCFNHKHSNIFMEDWVYKGIYTYIEKVTAENKSKGLTTHLNIQWFGGEPTLAVDRIIEFMLKLKKIKNIIINSNVVTNGYLLELKLFKNLLHSGIYSFQVTLDGYKDNHDKFRILKNGQPTFDCIYNNLKKISQKTKDSFFFYIRGNFLKNNLESMKKLIEVYEEDFKEDKRFQLYFRPVDNYSNIEDDHDLESNICYLDKGIEIQNELSYKLLKEGRTDIRIFDPLPKPTYSWCDVDRHNHYIFHADGLVYVCDTIVGNRDKAKGKIYSNGDLILSDKIYKWRKSIFNEHLSESCKKCKMIPICMGGCRRTKILFNKKICYWTPKIIFDQMGKYEELKINFKREVI